jgi:DNA-binding YbaB/EbfC family protein
MGSGFSKMKKQAKALQAQFEEMQESLKNTSVTGSGGNGLVKLKMNGAKELMEITISPDCINKDDIEGLQDLIIAAHRDALKQLEDASPSTPFNF